MPTTPTSITRRKMLKTTTGAIVAGAANIGAVEPAKKRVIVIGGGIGGLSCAFDLMERGHDVTLLEVLAAFRQFYPGSGWTDGCASVGSVQPMLADGRDEFKIDAC